MLPAFSAAFFSGTASPQFSLSAPGIGVLSWMIALKRHLWGPLQDALKSHLEDGTSLSVSPLSSLHLSYHILGPGIKSSFA